MGQLLPVDSINGIVMELANYWILGEINATTESQFVRLVAIRQCLRFAAVGATGTLIQYFVLWAGVEYLGQSAALASGVGYAVGSIVNYLLNYFFTFESNKSHSEAAAKYYSVVAVGWCINMVLMWALVDRWGLYYWAAQLLTTAIGFIWNFLGSKWWAFKRTVKPL